MWTLTWTELYCRKVFNPLENYMCLWWQSILLSQGPHSGGHSSDNPKFGIIQWYISQNHSIYDCWLNTLNYFTPKRLTMSTALSMSKCIFLWFIYLASCCSNGVDSNMTSYHGDTAWEVIATSTFCFQILCYCLFSAKWWILCPTLVNKRVPYEKMIIY